MMYEVKKSAQWFSSEIMNKSGLIEFAETLAYRHMKDEEDAKNTILENGYYAVYELR